MKALSITLTLLLSYSCHGELYRCTSVSGKLTYSDHPCGNKAEAYQPPKEMGLSLKSISPPKSYPKKYNVKNTPTSTACNKLTPTQLRNLRVKRQFKKGIPTTAIEKRFGKADIINSGKGHVQSWHYKSERVKRSFKFEEDCLVNWSEKFNGKKSQLSKYQQ